MPYEKIMYWIVGLWFVSEIILGQITKIKSGESKSQDKYSLIVVILTLSIGLYYAIFFTKRNMGILPINPYITAISGLFFILAGIVIRWSAILTLRKYFSVHVRIREDHKVIQSGLYKYIRHPA